MSRNWSGRSLAGVEWPEEGLGLGRDCADLDTVYLQAPKKLWGLEAFQRSTGSSRMMLRIVLLWSILKDTLLLFRYYSESPSVIFFCWLMGRCLCAFMCGEVQRVGESHFSQVLWHIKGVFFVGCSFSRLTQNRLPIPTWGAHETLADCKEDAAAFGWWGRRMHSTGNRALDPHLSVCVCVCSLKASGRPAYLQRWLPLFAVLLQCMWGTPRSSMMDSDLD